jgi:hypothetical protein
MLLFAVFASVLTLRNSVQASLSGLFIAGLGSVCASPVPVSIAVMIAVKVSVARISGSPSG